MEIGTKHARLTTARSSTRSPARHFLPPPRPMRVAGHVRTKTSPHKQSHPFRDSSPPSPSPSSPFFLYSSRHSSPTAEIPSSFAFPPRAFAQPGANSIHGFITVQITTIYLHASPSRVGCLVDRRRRGRRRRRRRGRAAVHS